MRQSRPHASAGPTNNVTLNNITLISNTAFQKDTGHSTGNPVWQVVTNNQNVYVEPNTGQAIPVGASPSPAASASAGATATATGTVNVTSP